MNERIRELAEKSHLMGYMVHLYTVDAPAGYRVPLDNRKEAIEKFAELIVKECLTVIKQSDDNCMNEWDYAERDLAGQIKEHFGIEEK